MSTGNPNVPGNPNVTGPGGRWTRGDSASSWGWAWLWFVFFICLIILAGWGWGGWWGWWGAPGGQWGNQWQGTQQNQGSQPSVQTTAPGEFVGRTVTVKGTVDQVLSPHAFTLSGSEGGRQLLVISKSEHKESVKKGETVSVTGSVEKYDPNTLHGQTNLDLNKVPSNEFEGRPTVVASSVVAKTNG